jgi:trimethylamine--corrinoid protein Co-methyltransferase
LTHDQIETIHNASLRVLEQTGLVINSDKSLKLLTDAGCNVDLSKRTVKIPTSVVQAALEKVPRSVTLHAREPQPDLHLNDGDIYTRISANCLQVIDSQTGAGRLALTKDQEDFVKLCDALKNVNILAPPFATADVPPEIRDVYGAECVLRGTRKHAHLPAYSNKNLDHIIRLATIVTGGAEELKRVPIISFFAAPEAALYYGEVADMMIKAASFGLAIGVIPTVVAGGTGPITLAGTLVQSNAEVLCGTLLIQLTNPGTPVIYSTAPVDLNMRTGNPLLGTIEFGMKLVGIAQLARYYNMPSNVYGLGTDSKTLDEQTAFEKAFLLTLSALGGANIIYSPGVMESDISQSYEQTVIDCELLDIVRRLKRGIDVSEETLALDTIARVGPRGHYLKQEHTRDYFTREYFIPELSDRMTRAMWEKLGSKNIVTKAREKVGKILGEHEVPTLPKDILSEMKLVLRDAEKGVASGL